MKREYFHSRTEFPCGYGDVFTEFIEDVATRQISRPDVGIAYSSSSIRDWDPEIGFFLFDGTRDELEIAAEDAIEKECFETVWKLSINNPPQEAGLEYGSGNAAVAQMDSTLIAHVVNNLGKWGRGFVLSLGEKYPVARDAYLDLFKKEERPVLGLVQFIPVEN